MYRFFWILSLMLLISCAESDKEAVTKNKEVNEVNFNNDKVEITEETTINNGLYIEKHGDSLYYINDTSVIVKVFLEPMQWVDKEKGVYKIDTAKILANCLIVYRGLEKGAPELCGTLPKFDKLEIYTKKGRYLDYGSKHNQSFFGGYEEENATWVILNYEAEGDYGDWKILKENGEINEIESSIELGYSINGGTLSTINDTTKVIEKVGLGLKHQGVDLTIFKSGNYKVKFHLDTTDIAAFYAFPNHESSIEQIKDQSYFGVGINENGDYYIDVVHKEIINQGVVSGDAIYQPFFYYSGITTCINKGNLLKVDNSIRSINKKDVFNINEMTQIKLEKDNIVCLQNNEQKILFSLDSKHPDYKLINEVQIIWSADINCDGYDELLIQFELGNTFYKYLIGADSNGKYGLLASDSLYWD